MLSKIKWMAIYLSLAGVALIILLVSSIHTDDTSEAFFKKYLNTPTPSGVSNFKGEVVSGPIVLATDGYVTYSAEPVYFDFLSKHDDFIWKDSEFNRTIKQIDCSDFEKHVTITEKVSMINKLCYEGRFSPYLHKIVYDPAARTVGHWVFGTME